MEEVEADEACRRSRMCRLDFTALPTPRCCSGGDRSGGGGRGDGGGDGDCDDSSRVSADGSGVHPGLRLGAVHIEVPCELAPSSAARRSDNRFRSRWLSLQRTLATPKAYPSSEPSIPIMKPWITMRAVLLTLVGVLMWGRRRR